MRSVSGSRLLGSALVVGGVLTGTLMLGTATASADEGYGAYLAWKTKEELATGPCGYTERTYSETVRFDTPRNTSRWATADTGKSSDKQIESSVEYQEGVIEAKVYTWCSEDQTTRYKQYIPTDDGYQHRTRMAAKYCNLGCWVLPPDSDPEWQDGQYPGKWK